MGPSQGPNAGGRRPVVVRLLLVCLVALMAIPVSVAQTDPLSPAERAWVDAHGPIRYAPDPGYPPFEQVTEDGVEGINVDLLNRISRNLDIEFETVVYDNWTAVLEAMQAREVDLLGSLAQTEEREVYMDFYGPYMEVGEVYYVRADSPLRSNEEMSGKRVAVIQDYAAGTWLAENRPDVERVPVPDMTAGLEAVSTGQVDGFFENVPVAGYVIRTEGYNNIRILDEPLYYSPANWGVQEGNAILLSIMEKGMDSVPQGEQTAIFEYWSGYDLGVRRDVPVTPFYQQPVVWGLAGATLLAVGWVVSLRRTVRHRTRELEELNDTLEARVKQRTHALEQANASLEAFAASVSHDLKQPLVAMRMQCKIAAIHAERGMPQDLRMLDRQVDRMESFVEALLAFSRTPEPQGREEADVAPIVREVEELLAAGDGPRCEVVVDDDLQAYADPQLLRVVLLNLIGNAWKFSQAVEAPRIEVGGDGSEFYVRDNGPGFDAEAMGERIFRPFVRGADVDGVSGMGVGLATVARIVEGHGGRIWAVSQPGAGATFHWTMPRPASGRRPPRPRRQTAAAARTATQVPGRD